MNRKTKLNAVRLMLLMTAVLLVNGLSAQTLNGLTGQAATAVQSEYSGFKVLMKWIMFFMCSGGFLVFIWAAFFQHERMKMALSGLIVGIITGAVALSLQFLS